MCNTRKESHRSKELAFVMQPSRLLRRGRRTTPRRTTSWSVPAGQAGVTSGAASRSPAELGAVKKKINMTRSRCCPAKRWACRALPRTDRESDEKPASAQRRRSVPSKPSLDKVRSPSISEPGRTFFSVASRALSPTNNRDARSRRNSRDPRAIFLRSADHVASRARARPGLAWVSFADRGSGQGWLEARFTVREVQALGVPASRARRPRRAGS